MNVRSKLKNMILISKYLYKYFYCIFHSLGAVEKVLFNRKERKVGAKDAKLMLINSVLCDLCEGPRDSQAPSLK